MQLLTAADLEPGAAIDKYSLTGNCYGVKRQLAGGMP
jgi:hypothetical protein